MYESLTAPRGALDSSLTDARSVVNYLATKGLQAVIFCNEVGQLADHMLPATASQNNGSAPDVDDSGQSLESMGVPSDVPIYLCLWIESIFQQTGSTSYYDVGMMMFVNKYYGIPYEQLLK